jgi:hypothetical protein
MGTIQELDNVEEDDTVDSFSYRSKWCIYGFTRAEMATAADIAIVDEFTPRTSFLAKHALIASIPAYIGVAPLTRVKTIEKDVFENYYEFAVDYEAGAGATPAANEPSEPSTGTNERAKPRPSIRVATQSVVRQVARGDIRVYGKTADLIIPDAPRGILPDGKGGFRGAEVMVPSLSWSESHVIPAGDFSLEKALEICGMVNSTEFRGRPAGTVLCLGGSADQRPDDGFWDASIEFQYSPKLTAEKAPGFEDYDDVTKGGWEFMFPLTDAAGNVTALCVAPLYEEVNFGSIVPSLA